MGECCKRWMERTPCGSLIGTVICLLGSGAFCFTVYIGCSISIVTFEPVIRINSNFIDKMQVICVGVFIGMASLAALIIYSGLLSSGSTRIKVYLAKRILCAVFLVITYLVYLGWTVILCLMVLVTFTFMIFSGICSSVDAALRELEFTPNSTLDKLSKTYDIGKFCEERVERATMVCILATVSAFVIILSLVQYLMCLATNYTHIRDDEKIQELLKIQRLAQMEYRAPSRSRVVELHDMSTEI